MTDIKEISPDELHGWFAPNGEYIEIDRLHGDRYHLTGARYICDKLGFKITKDSPEDELYDRGWRKVSHNEIYMGLHLNRNVTEGQLKTFKMILSIHGRINFLGDEIYSNQEIMKYLKQNKFIRIKNIGLYQSDDDVQYQFQIKDLGTKKILKETYGLDYMRRMGLQTDEPIEVFGLSVVAFWNMTLRPGRCKETPREFISVKQAARKHLLDVL